MLHPVCSRPWWILPQHPEVSQVGPELSLGVSPIVGRGVARAGAALAAQWPALPAIDRRNRCPQPWPLRSSRRGPGGRGAACWRVVAHAAGRLRRGGRWRSGFTAIRTGSVAFGRNRGPARLRRHYRGAPWPAGHQRRHSCHRAPRRADLLLRRVVRGDLGRCPPRRGSRGRCSTRSSGAARASICLVTHDRTGCRSRTRWSRPRPARPAFACGRSTGATIR